MEYDDIIEHIGQFGRYQKRVYFLLCLPAVTVGIQTLLSVFILAVPDHRCALPNILNDTYNEQSKIHSDAINFTIPVDKSQTFSQCRINNVSAFITPNTTESLNTSQAVTIETMACDAWVYDTSIFTSTLVTELDLVCERKMSKTLAQMFFMVGSLVGCFLVGPPADLFGRKAVMLVALLIHKISSIVQAFTFSFTYLCVLQFLNGAAGMSLYCSCFVLGMELVGVKTRKIAGYVVVIFFGVGVALVTGFAYLLRDWQHLQLATGSISVLFIGYYWLIPESPRWLISRNRRAEAELIIRKAAKVNKRDVPSEAFKSDSLIKEHAREPLWRLITYPRLVIRTLIIYFDWTVCSMVYYGLGLNVGNLGGSIFLNSLLYGIVEIVSYFVCILLSDKMGRKKLFLANIFLAGLSCAASPFPKLYSGPEYQWLSITFAIIGKFGASAAFATIWVYSSELFPTVIRSSGMASSSLSARIGGVLSPYIANLSLVIAEPTGQILPLEIFGGLSLIAGLISLFLPETTNTKLPETLKDANAIGMKGTLLVHTVTEMDYMPVATDERADTKK